MPVLQKRLRFWLVGWLGALLVRALHATWRVTLVDPPGVAAGARDGSRPVIAAFWHRHLLSMLAHCRGYRVCVPVSEHRDGEYVAQVMDRFGLASVRGSTTRGSLKLIRGMLAAIKERWSPAITPDGPRGPRYSVQAGVALLARRSRLPVHPVGVAAKSNWVLPSWDAFVIPKPWTRVAIVVGPALEIAPDEDASVFAADLRKAIFAATDAAEQAVRENA
jgi:hypothetical protein